MQRESTSHALHTEPPSPGDTGPGKALPAGSESSQSETLVEGTVSRGLVWSVAPLLVTGPACA